MIDSFDPRIVSLSPFEITPFETLQERGVMLPTVTKERYDTIVENYKKTDDMIVQRMIYKVDGLNVTGMIATPAVINAPCPILIYNRGGNGEFGRIALPVIMRIIHPFVKKGFIVLGSNYRGNDGGEGLEEFGGADIHDVLELVDIAKSHPHWDGKNVYMFGASRGGLMTYVAIKHGVTVNAAVSMAAPSDLIRQCSEREDMARVFARRIPNHEENDRQAYKDRSALFWPEDLAKTPVLILHGDQDERVHIGHSMDLDKRLTDVQAQHKTVIYPGDNHSLSQSWPQAFEETMAWFDRYKR